MDRLELEAFVAVAEELHFGRAAERLHRGQPTVSDAVKRLEVTLGGRLLHRTSRRVSLTELGDAMLPDARAALAQLRRFQQRGTALASGAGADATLTVGLADFTDHDRLLRCLPELRERAPGLTILPEPMATSAQLTALRAETIGLGIGWATGDLSGVAATVLSTERFVALVPADHPLASREELRAPDLSATGLLTWPHQLNSGLCDRLLAAFHVGGADLRIVRTADSVQALATHVVAGTGIGITVRSAVDAVPAGVSVVPLAGPSTTADQVVLTREAPSVAAATLVELLRAGDAVGAR